jgi:hypothetical protein
MNGPAEDLTKRTESERSGAERSRREWLLCLGEAAVLMGLGGTIRQGKEGFWWAAPADAAGLPPGLYVPSNDGLSHALSSEGEYHPIPSGSETDYLRPRTAPFQSQWFSPADFRVLRRFVELMLGPTRKSSGASPHDTERDARASQAAAEWIDFSVASAPRVRQAARRVATAHRAVAAAYYGADTVAQLEAHEPEKICRAGLLWLEQESQDRHQNSFIGLLEAQQLELLKLISDDRPEKGAENPGTRFFALIKAEVVRAYYTSKAGLEELDFKGNAFYPASPGCSNSS